MIQIAYLNPKYFGVSTQNEEEDVFASKGKRVGILFLVETSGSMKGANIEEVERVLKKVIELTKDRNGVSCGLSVEVGILSFDSMPRWLIRPMTQVEKTYAVMFPEAKGASNLGTALASINESLTASTLKASTPSEYPTIITLLMDGAPSDIGIYQDSLERLRRNQWFRHSIKLGVALGRGASMNECLEVIENVIDDQNYLYRVMDVHSLSDSLVEALTQVLNEISSDDFTGNLSKIPGKNTNDSSVSVNQNDSIGTADTATYVVPYDWYNELVF